jgi:hypothetical protein
MKRIAVFILCFGLPLFVNAANVLIWEFDPLDVFYDNQISRSVDCPYWLEQTLGAGGHTYTTTNSLPADLSAYQVVFVTLGWFRC